MTDADVVDAHPHLYAAADDEPTDRFDTLHRRAADGAVQVPCVGEGGAP